MFPTTGARHLDPRLGTAVATVEAGRPGLRVIAARCYRLPYARLRARIAFQHPRRLNILEEFVLRAASELEPAPTPPELAALLGLDQLFVNATLQELEGLGTIKRSAQADVGLTPLGRKFFQEGQVPLPADHKTVSLLYDGAFDRLAVWAPPPSASADLPLLPGVSEEDREAIGARALKAAGDPARLADLPADDQKLLSGTRDDGQRLTGVDQVALEDLGFYAAGVIVTQDLLAEDGADNVSLFAIDLDAQAPDPELQRRLEEWLAAGRARLTDFLKATPEAAEPLPAAGEATPLEPDYAQLYRERLRGSSPSGQSPAGLALLGASERARRAEELRRSAAHTVLVLLPRLSAPSADEALRAELAELAERHVLSVVGWGTADEREQEPASPAPGVIEALHGLTTPDGIPAAPVWWVGQLYGQDLLFDQTTLVSAVLSPLILGGRPLAPSTAAYVVSDPKLVEAAVGDLEPPFARAARLAWHGAVRAPQATRQVLERCCVTWVAVRRAGEALSHLLKLASAEPEAMRVCWELLSATCLALARLPEPALAETEAAEALRRFIPEFLDWADSAPAEEGQPAFIPVFRELLGRQVPEDEAALARLLREARALWRATGQAEPGQKTLDVFAPAPKDARGDRPKKRRY